MWQLGCTTLTDGDADSKSPSPIEIDWSYSCRFKRFRLCRPGFELEDICIFDICPLLSDRRIYRVMKRSRNDFASDITDWGLIASNPKDRIIGLLGNCRRCQRAWHIGGLQKVMPFYSCDDRLPCGCRIEACGSGTLQRTVVPGSAQSLRRAFGNERDRIPHWCLYDNAMQCKVK